MLRDFLVAGGQLVVRDLGSRDALLAIDQPVTCPQADDLGEIGNCPAADHLFQHLHRAAPGDEAFHRQRRLLRAGAFERGGNQCGLWRRRLGRFGRRCGG